jgi:cell fate regulator YaaT (PSP1 superfamily)
MPNVVSVRFKPVTKIYFFAPNGITDLKIEDRVIVETSRGTEMGVVIEPVHEVPNRQVKGKLKSIVRKATPVDLVTAEDFRAQEEDALETCNKLVKKLGIPIKVIKAEFNFDGSRLAFAFTSEQRIDFRDLVKELTRRFRTRIEMKQVGARDETKLIDGYGRCGRRLCCSSWLTEFHPVSIKMAKTQDLPLAPSEISGLCGRLLCCLAYENETYIEVKKVLPKVGSQVEMQHGVTARVKGLNVIKETVLLEIQEEETMLEVPANELNYPKPDAEDKSSGKNEKRSNKN